MELFYLVAVLDIRFADVCQTIVRCVRRIRRSVNSREMDALGDDWMLGALDFAPSSKPAGHYFGRFPAEDGFVLVNIFAVRRNVVCGRGQAFRGWQAVWISGQEFCLAGNGWVSDPADRLVLVSGNREVERDLVSRRSDGVCPQAGYLHH